MKVINAKTLQLAIEKIDEYRAKYRKEGESFGFHFSGEQKQGWTDAVIKNKMLYVKYGSTTSPKFSELQPYADLRTAKAEGKYTGDVPEPWTYPYPYFTAKLILNPSQTSCKVTFELIKNEKTLESTSCDLGWPNNNEVLWFTQVKCNDGQDVNQVEQIRITVTDQSTNQPSPFYIQYLNFGNNELLKYSGPINILDGNQLDQHLRNQSSSERKFIFDEYSSISEMFESKTSDNNCSTCDINVCSCYGAVRYGYVPCTQDTCEAYRECTCNESCHLQASSQCVCDHMFYSIHTTDPTRAFSTPIAKNVDLLAKVKPQLENLTQTGPNTYEKVNPRLPGYLHYTFDTPYALTDESNLNIEADNIRVFSKTQAKNWTADIKRDPRFEGAKMFFLGAGDYDYVIVAQLTRGIPTDKYWQWGWDPSTKNYLYGDQNSIEFEDGDNDLGVSYDILVYKICSGVSSYSLELVRKFSHELAISQGEQNLKKIPMDFCKIQVYETSYETPDETSDKTSDKGDTLKYSIVVLLNNTYVGNGFLSATCFSIDSKGNCELIQRKHMEQTWYKDYHDIIRPGENFYFLCIHNENILMCTMAKSSYNKGCFNKLFRNFRLVENPLEGTEDWHRNCKPAVNPEVLQGLQTLEIYATGVAVSGSVKGSYAQGGGVVEYADTMSVLYTKITESDLDGYSYRIPAIMRSAAVAERVIFSGDVASALTSSATPDGTSRRYPFVKLLFEYKSGSDDDAVYALDIIVDNEIYHTDDITAENVEWTTSLTLQAGEYVCCIGFTQYFKDANKFFIYRNLDGNSYLKPLYNNGQQTSDKGILVSQDFKEGLKFLSLSNHGILSSGGISANIGGADQVLEISDSGDFNALSIELNNNTTEFSKFSLVADSIYYDEEKSTDSKPQSIPCGCYQAQYYGQSCVCDGVCDRFTYTCDCYAKSY